MVKMLSIAGVLASLSMAALAQGADSSPTTEVRRVIQEFEQAIAARNLAKVEPLVATDIVVFENGGRNDGWTDFRDNHLVPEMKEPAPPSKTELVRVVATPQMGWGYSKTDMTLTRSSGETVEALLWSTYVVEKRGEAWKIVMLDWSFKAPRPSQAPESAESFPAIAPSSANLPLNTPRAFLACPTKNLAPPRRFQAHSGADLGASHSLRFGVGS